MIKVVQNAVKQYNLQQEEESLQERKRKYNNDLELLVAEKMKDLNESEIKYKNLVEQSLVGVCVLQNGKFQYVSPKFLELFDYTFEEVVEKLNLLDIVAPKDRPLVEKYHNKILKGILDHKQFSFTAIDKSKQEVEVEVWWGNVIYEGKTAVQAIISDISDRKIFHIKEKSYELRMMNEQKLASIGQLATGIAHNLNTPISVIMSNAEILQLKHPDSPELDKIIRQAERMSAIIRGLLTKSKQEQNQNAQMIDLNKLISNELEFLNANLEFKHNIEKEYHFAEKLPRINAVYSDFSQSIMNILQNAIDAMYKQPEKKLTVTTKLENDNIYIIISDTGVGFNEADYLKLFEPFYTTKPSPMEQINNEPTGTGLGLSTVHNLLTPYGVEIEVNSKANVGTTFSLCIPLNQVRTPAR
jgi:PAS domain S-box-containing protein